jgi:hypothetical protein
MHPHAIRRECCHCHRVLPNMTHQQAADLLVTSLQGPRYFLCPHCRETLSQDEVKRILAYVPDFQRAGELK